MTALHDERRLASDAVIETPSGKWREAENFPVGSFLIRRDLRPHVHAFYRFARNADDIADNPELLSDEKIKRLDRIAAILDGSPGQDSPAAAAMRESLRETGVTAQHCHDVLRAFRLDAVKRRYRDWDDLMDYCRYSASPVGRQLLDLHGESRGAWEASDALCSALQVLNHLQDCAEDYCRLDRVYLPLQDLAAAEIGVEALAAAAASPALRRVIDGLLDRTKVLIDTAHGLPPGVASAGLRWESAVIIELAARLLRRLREGDPLAMRVKLHRSDFFAALVIGVSGSLRRRAMRRSTSPPIGSAKTRCAKRSGIGSRRLGRHSTGRCGCCRTNVGTRCMQSTLSAARLTTSRMETSRSSTSLPRLPPGGRRSARFIPATRAIS